MEKYNMNFYALPHGSDAANDLKKKFEVRGIPSLVIVDADGNTITKNGRGDVSGNPSGAVRAGKRNLKAALYLICNKPLPTEAFL